MHRTMHACADSRALPLNVITFDFQQINKPSHSLTHFTLHWDLLRAAYFAIVYECKISPSGSLCRRFSFAFKMLVIVLFSLLQARLRATMCMDDVFRLPSAKLSSRAHSHLTHSCWGAYYICAELCLRAGPCVETRERLTAFEVSADIFPVAQSSHGTT